MPPCIDALLSLLVECCKPIRYTIDQNEVEIVDSANTQQYSRPAQVDPDSSYSDSSRTGDIIGSRKRPPPTTRKATLPVIKDWPYDNCKQMSARTLKALTVSADDIKGIPNANTSVQTAAACLAYSSISSRLLPSDSDLQY